MANVLVPAVPSMLIQHQCTTHVNRHSRDQAPPKILQEYRTQKTSFTQRVDLGNCWRCDPIPHQKSGSKTMLSARRILCTLRFFLFWFWSILLSYTGDNSVIASRREAISSQNCLPLLQSTAMKEERGGKTRDGRSIRSRTRQGVNYGE